MNASKESGRHAMENLIDQERFMNGYAFNVIRQFLEAAYKKEKTRGKRSEPESGG